MSCSLIREASSAFARSSKVRVLFEPSLRLTNRDWTRCIRPGRTGTGRSSPSEAPPDTAGTVKAYGPTPRGAASANATSAPPPASAEKAAEVPPAGRPKSEETFALESVSRISIVTRPDIFAAEALLTTTLSCARSASRRNRGTYGRTIRSLTLWASFSTEPAFRSRVTAWTQTFQDVTESGTVNSIAADPEESVRRCGIQKAVSAKLPRSSTNAAAGGAGAGEATAPVPCSARMDIACGSPGPAAVGTVALEITASDRIPPRRPGPPSPYPSRNFRRSGASGGGNDTIPKSSLETHCA